jgi:hypothetical protein
VCRDPTPTGGGKCAPRLSPHGSRSYFSSGRGRVVGSSAAQHSHPEAMRYLSARDTARSGGPGETGDRRSVAMDSRVAVRFFRVSEPPPGVPDFGDILQQISEIPAPADREQNLGEGVNVRLESCAARGQTLEGDLCRIQTVNIPPQAGAEGLEPLVLGDGNGIGHMAAFAYHRPTRVLLLQSNNQSVTPNRLALYAASWDPAQIFHLSPVLTDDALERFQAGRARSFVVKFAGIDRLDALDDPDLPVARGAVMIGNAYEGLEVEIKVSVGRQRDRTLSLAALGRTIARLAGEPGVEKLQAKLEGDDRALDLLHEQLQAAQELQLPEGDPERHYAVRRQYLAQILRNNMPTLTRQFGAPDGDGER